MSSLSNIIGRFAGLTTWAKGAGVNPRSPPSQAWKPLPLNFIAGFASIQPPFLSSINQAIHWSLIWNRRTQPDPEPTVSCTSFITCSLISCFRNMRDAGGRSPLWLRIQASIVFDSSFTDPARRGFGPLLLSARYPVLVWIDGNLAIRRPSALRWRYLMIDVSTWPASLWSLTCALFWAELTVDKARDVAAISWDFAWPCTTFVSNGPLVACALSVQLLCIWRVNNCSTRPVILQVIRHRTSISSQSHRLTLPRLGAIEVVVPTLHYYFSATV